MHMKSEEKKNEREREKKKKLSVHLDQTLRPGL